WRTVKIVSSALRFVFGCLSIGAPRPSSSTVTDAPSAWSTTRMFDAKPFMASSMALSRISQTRWCSPVEPTPPMYIPGRFRTGSRPSRTVMSLAVYVVLAIKKSLLLGDFCLELSLAERTVGRPLLGGRETRCCGPRNGRSERRILHVRRHLRGAVQDFP